MRVIYKYRVLIRREFELEFPMGFEILSFKRQDKHPVLWVLHDLDYPKVAVKFRLVGTGQPIDEKYYSGLKFIDTEIFGNVVFHLFQILEYDHEKD